ncbi:M36 family metallopeptidase [Tenggerimyces flavus]|uniref:M36 family metallopeptidase n=1 Tax=Tenggerimyces flavus TaxID=1708749 RepID=A0ABV7YP27_9ACTN|nr:M36 family metallopeptidase [Tenggerimyces flavus]MBM7789498.1 hypothetical protein [Tenggerimyces flavus]
MRAPRTRCTDVLRRAPILALATAALVVSVHQPAQADGASTNRPGTLLNSSGVPAADSLSTDHREGRIGPTDAQRARVTELGATARWTKFGTVATLSPTTPDKPLAQGREGDPAAVARGFVDANRVLFRQNAQSVDQLEVVTNAPLPGTTTPASVVVLRERFGGIPAGAGGLITIAVAGNRVEYASSSAYGAASTPAKPTLTAITAWRAAARSLGRQLPGNAVRPLQTPTDPRQWATFTVAGLAQVQQVRLTAVGVPGQGVRPAYETNVVDVQNGTALAATSFVDAVTGAILVRANRVDALTGKVQKAPPSGFDALTGKVQKAPPSGCDATLTGCGVRLSSGPVNAISSMLAGGPQGDNGLGGLGGSQGENAITTEAWSSPLSAAGASSPPYGSPAPSREFADVWRTSGCDVANLTPGGNDIDAAVKEVFTRHNALHDWTYDLGFTERTANLQRASATSGDPEVGYVQSGALTGGYPTYLGRNNANQATLQDGIPGITNLYLFQPVAAQWYGPCVDGAFDPTVVAHEYAHAVTERLAAGPDLGLSAPNAQGLGESWSDLIAAEYLLAHGETGRGEARATAIGGYVAGNPKRGIRNYPVGSSPLNFGNLGYDLAGPDAAADGEIWSAANWDVRAALIAKYDKAFPVANAELQQACAAGERPTAQCPGNRRWLQLVFDSLLLLQPDSGMPTARDALLAADRLRFGGANQAEIWQAFAHRGLGIAATLTPLGAARPDFTTPFGAEGTLLVKAVEASSGRPLAAAIRIGRYQAGTSPVTTTDARAGVPRHLHFVPGTYDLTWSAQGYGMGRARVTIVAGRTSWLTLHLSRNVASATNGARAAAEEPSAAGLIDDSEASAWSVTGRTPDAIGAAATIDLAGSAPQAVRSVRVSALPRSIAGTPSADGGMRFASLRSFALEACSVACGTDAGWRRFYTSPADAFPAGRPRPVTPDLVFREFDVPDVSATQLRLVVLSTQCTGAPAYVSEQDTDPLSTSDCRASATVQDATVAELMAYGTDPASRRPSTAFDVWE